MKKGHWITLLVLVAIGAGVWMYMKRKAAAGPARAMPANKGASAKAM